MKICRVLLAITICAIFSTPVLAQPQGEAPQGAAPQGQPPQGQAGGSSDGVILDMAPFFKAVDTDKDDKVAKAEWMAAGLPEMVYDMFDREGAGSFSLESMAEKTHPPTIDADKDGKLTLDELKAHIASQSGGQ